MARRLGLLGPIVVLVGAAAAALGVWFMTRARSEATAYLDVFALDGETALVVRAERSSNRNFVELRHRDGTVAWQAMIPTYAGRPGAPGLAASREAASVRVVRNSGAEVFGLSMTNASKLGAFKLAADRPREASGHTLPAAVTLTDLRSSFELVGQEKSPAWAAIAAINLGNGKMRWDVELGAAQVTSAGVAGEVVWVQQGGKIRGFRTADGAPIDFSITPPDPDAPVRLLLDEGGLRVEFDRRARELLVTSGGQPPTRRAWPAEALEPWPYHLAGGRLWIVSAERLDTLVVAAPAPTTPPPPTGPGPTPLPAAN